MAAETKYLNVVVEGCCHGALDQIYASVKQIEKKRGVSVDLLLICGDFQAIRNESDFQSLAVPAKYRDMESFWKYYKGEAVAPVPTVVIGGNHEASNFMKELFHGGWLAPNIYYLGAAGVVNFGGIRIGGLSGIYKSHDYHKGNYERPPFDHGSLRSAYHIRSTQVFQLAHLCSGTGHGRRPVDVFMSHDWPAEIYHFGDKDRLIRNKPFFRDEINSNTLGSPPAMSLLRQLRPPYWFSAHLHCKFAALVPHIDPAPAEVPPVIPEERDEGTASASGAVGTQPQPQVTRFLALDKCLPRRDFLQLLTLERPADSTDPPVLCYDPEWMAIMQATHHLLSNGRGRVNLPAQSSFVSQEQIQAVEDRVRAVHGSLAIPANFTQTAPAYPAKTQRSGTWGNPQTDSLLDLLGLPHRVTQPSSGVPSSRPIPPPTLPVSSHPPAAADSNVIDIDDIPDSDEESTPTAANAQDATSPAVVDPNEVDIDEIDDEDQ